MMGPHIKTFDGQDIIYEICNHVAMKDIKNAKFNVTGNFALFLYNLYYTRNTLMISTLTYNILHRCYLVVTIDKKSDCDLKKWS